MNFGEFVRFIQKLNLNFDYEVEIVLKEANTKKNAEVVEQICPERSQVVGIGNSALQNLNTSVSSMGSNMLRRNWGPIPEKSNVIQSYLELVNNNRDLKS